MRTKKLVENAKILRKNQTDAELTLWQCLRGRQLKGLKFRRQVVVGNYIADFLCDEAKLIIEVDGGQHFENKCYDDKRTKYFSSLDFQVLRFWNNEVLEDLMAVLEKIWMVINKSAL